jgi:hypothetical protein
MSMFNAALDTEYASFKNGIPAASSTEPIIELMKMSFLPFPLRIRGRKKRIRMVLLMISRFSSSEKRLRSLYKDK